MSYGRGLGDHEGVGRAIHAYRGWRAGEGGMNARRILAADGVPSLVTLLVVLVIFSLSSAQFLSIENLRNILVQSTFVLFISVGMTFVLTVGAIDLSVGTAL